jgi:gas vesicle protein
MKTSERILWLMVGAAVGAGIALLYAPKTGKDTRKLIRRKAEDARETIADTSEQIRDRVVETTEQVMGAGRDIYKKGAEFATAAAGVFEAGRRIVTR